MHTQSVTGRMRHGIDETSYQTARPRGELRILAPARVHDERLAARECGHLVGEQACRIDDGVRLDAFARRDDDEAAVATGLDADERRAGQYRAVASLDFEDQSSSLRLGLDPPVSADQSPATACTSARVG